MRALLFLWRHDVASSENRPLSKRQQLFVTHFIEGASGVKAAEAAGYRGDDRALRSTASRLLTYRNIKKAIRQAYADAGVDPAAILGKLAALAFGDSTAQVQLRALEIMARAHSGDKGGDRPGGDHPGSAHGGQGRGGQACLARGRRRCHLRGRGRYPRG
ncbi:MAG: terminase small subunit [Planctomycetota bacterium]